MIVDESCVPLESDYQRISCPEQLDPDGTIALCKAIALQLIEDYCSCIKYMRAHEHKVDSKKYVAANKQKKEIERFVRTGFFYSMFDIDGSRFLKMVVRRFNP